MMNNAKIAWVCLVLLFPFSDANGQQKDSIELRITGYLDAYYSYFTDSIGPNALQKAATVSPRSGRFGLNIAQIGVHYRRSAVRGNLSLHYGDIVQATWSETFSPVQQANLGFRFAGNWWLDAGFFTTHIGTESFLPKNNFLSSTSVATYNEPFYQAGARLSYEGSEKFGLEIWAVNGYNFFLDANNAKSLGFLFSYDLSDHTKITYTNLFGLESAQGARPGQFRTYHNLYLNTSFDGRIFVTLGGDLGTQRNSGLSNSRETALMYNALLTLKYQFAERFSMTGRAEVFQDPDGFISGVYLNDGSEQQGLQLWALTLGGEYRPMENAYLRLEVRYLQADDALTIFNNEHDPATRWEAMATLGVYFDEKLDLK